MMFMSVLQIYSFSLSDYSTAFEGTAMIICKFMLFKSPPLTPPQGGGLAFTTEFKNGWGFLYFSFQPAGKFFKKVIRE